MIDFDPSINDVILPPDLAMQFLVWAVYYNGIELKEDTSFSSYACNGKALFAPEDAARLDRIKAALFKCFDQGSVDRSSAQLRKAKALGEICPFPKPALDALFGSTIADA